MLGLRDLFVVGLVASLVATIATPAAAQTQGNEGLPNVDRRDDVRAKVPQRTTASRNRLERSLGPLADVRTDPIGGGVDYVGRPTGLLTGPSSESPRTIALDYVREHGEIFGLSKADFANLVLVAEAVSPDGITHLRFNQVLDGIQSFDSGLQAHVTRDGRLINVSGAPVPNAELRDTTPTLTAGEGLAEARQATRGSGGAPRATTVKPGPSRATTFATGEQARLRWSASADGPVLAWHLVAGGEDEHFYDVLVDASDGALMRRQDLTQHLGEGRYFARDPDTTPVPTQITMPPSWYDESAGGTRLWGQLSRTYLDPGDEDPAGGSEQGGTRVQIPASAGAPGAPDWLYDQSHDFPGATACPASGCTWNSAIPSTAAANQFQAAANAHVLVSRFHDHLAAAPIGFDEASGNFQRTNSGGSGLGGDYVRTEINDGQGLNNANMSTPPDGSPPRMQMFLYDQPDVNSSDDAGIVYHEYGHGLSNRLVVNAAGSSGLGAMQSRMMGEAWSDFYALDLLNAEGALPDTAAPGEVTIGSYVGGSGGGGGLRAKPIDCPVDPSGATFVCNYYATAEVPGGYTYGDIATAFNSTPHNGGEVWGETLWDMRSAVGREDTLALVTGGMRLSAVNPSMLDMRDAILQQAVATRSAAGAADDLYDDLWRIFMARGMGSSASTAGPNSTTPTEAYDAPSGLRARSTTFSDPAPGGDGDGTIEPGETVRVEQAIEGIGLADLPGVTGTMTSTDAALDIVDGTAAWPVLGQGRRAVNSDALLARLPANSCTPRPISIAVNSSEGNVVANATIDPRIGSSTVVPLRDPGTEGGEAVTTATFDVRAGGTISDVDVRIDELRHSWLGELRIEVVHDGVTAVLYSLLDGGNFGGDDILDAIFDSDAGAALPTTGAGPITGRVRTQPANSLDAFDGRPAAGEWTLRVTDISSNDSGELRRWGLDSPEVPCDPPEAPTAVTGAASAIGTSTATVAGSVTPKGTATGVRFAYGTTDAYGSTTPVQDAGDGTDAFAATADLTALTPNTTYHYRVEAVRGGELAAAGEDRTFKTAEAPRISLPGVVRSSTNWLLRDTLSSGEATSTFSFGTRPLVPFTGDWDGDGSRTPGTFSSGTLRLYDQVPAESTSAAIAFGDSRGFPVAGDFDGDKRDDVAIYRNGAWQIRLATGATSSTTFGSGSWPSTVPVAGDWDGDGIDGIGTYAGGTWTLRETATAGAISPFPYGALGAYPVVGDWDADGTDTVGVKSTSGPTWSLSNSNQTPATAITFDFGFANDLPVVWR